MENVTHVQIVLTVSHAHQAAYLPVLVVLPSSGKMEHNVLEDAHHSVYNAKTLPSVRSVKMVILQLMEVYAYHVLLTVDIALQKLQDYVLTVVLDST